MASGTAHQPHRSAPPGFVPVPTWSAAPGGGGPPAGWVPVPPPWTPVPWTGGGERPRGGRRAGWRMVGVFAMAEFTFLMVSALVLLPFDVGGDPADLPGPALMLALVVPTICAATVAVSGTRRWGFGPGPAWDRVRRELAFHPNWPDVGRGLAYGGAGLILTIPAAALWSVWVGEDDANSAVGEAFDGQSLHPLIAVTIFLSVWLIAPVCEEVLFRGVLWRAFEHWGWNRWVVFGATTVLFSVAHLELLRTPLLLVISIPIGLSRLVTGNLAASIVAHQLNNLLPAIGLLLIALGVVEV